ncbi:hypothetical protein DM02DRAFT_733022 [Periconia macrospinosa]|uniref:Uncharacterized protein n=1 Tax=Periconia macrospinosa TaxID=97972 RepID=A0A2V1D6D6_9PLEO|nr:hypothetical protein DM02DRAFT_733022 [Periconia macrospinosa]
MEALQTALPTELLDKVLDCLLLSWTYNELVEFCDLASLSRASSAALFERWIKLQQDDFGPKKISGTPELLFLEQHVETLRKLSVSVTCFVKFDKTIMWWMTSESGQAPKDFCEDNCPHCGKNVRFSASELPIPNSYMVLCFVPGTAATAELTRGTLEIVRLDLIRILSERANQITRNFVYGCLNKKGFSGEPNCGCFQIQCGRCLEGERKRFVVLQGKFGEGCVHGWTALTPVSERSLHHEVAFRKFLVDKRYSCLFQELESSGGF